MKNKIELKHYLITTLCVSICLLVLFLIINIYEYHSYTENFNNKISQIINTLIIKYPELTEAEIMEILNNSENNDTKIFEKYGIDIEKDSIVIENNKNFYKFLIINILFVIIFITIIVAIFLRFNKKKDKDINDIVNYVEEINKKNYTLKIDSISEDELSILKNEIYKTTIMLKEAAENSNIDKINLKKSLEDISHQLKTPLTSILIMLDNLIDDEEMQASVRNDFIREIRKEIININFLVQALLKLSNFDANTIHFIKENIEVRKILEEATQKISTLCDLKNIQIDIIGENKKAEIYVDFKWQVEAITNVLKNCVEHSKNDQKIVISYSQNKAYTMIKIRDFGEGISKKDIPHIFERFYKGENASKDSVGIGLALAKTIIENDNGTISVESNNEGTEFTIKYFVL